MQLVSRVVFTGIVVGMFWGGKHMMEKQVVDSKLPVVEQALSRMLVENERSVCVEGGPFPYNTRQGGSHWVSRYDGSLECRAGSSLGCPKCEELYQVGLLDKDTESYSDDEGNYGTTVTFRLTDKGKGLYYSDIHDRSVGFSFPCTPGETKSDEGSGEARHRPGFCFAKGIRLNKIEEMQQPQKLNNTVMMGVRYVPEAVSPSEVLFDPRMKAVLGVVPKRGNPALYPTVTTTAIFAPGGKEVMEFDGGIRYGKWINTP
ncbi:MAG: hypothetical protein Q7T36_04595 [Fluviicoccus sp.]|uniref:hypothetical protein n=1 Tax=Fluviicoccus sp. TaxID=2003552 RepID=UPI002724241F|nr:hypothetical protein [Fluviicoccus sp.]MDO8329731.1 hypothetical protein [Fluviicoccus sp.]